MHSFRSRPTWQQFPPHTDSGLAEAGERMSQLLQTAMVCLQLQNDREADVTARAAEARRRTAHHLYRITDTFSFKSRA